MPSGCQPSKSIIHTHQCLTAHTHITNYYPTKSTRPGPTNHCSKSAQSVPKDITMVFVTITQAGYSGIQSWDLTHHSLACYHKSAVTHWLCIGQKAARDKTGHMDYSPITHTDVIMLGMLNSFFHEIGTLLINSNLNSFSRTTSALDRLKSLCTQHGAEQITNVITVTQHTGLGV